MRLMSCQIALCKTQGLLFQRSAGKGFDSEKFINFFMNSDLADDLDSDWSPTQWFGEGYWLEDIEREFFEYSGNIWGEDTLYWIGYVYRYWQITSGMSSAEIAKIADADTMGSLYEAYHTIDVDLAITRIMEDACKEEPLPIP